MTKSVLTATVYISSSPKIAESVTDPSLSEGVGSGHETIAVRSCVFTCLSMAWLHLGIYM